MSCEVRGPGWLLFETADTIVLRFNSKPDSKTLYELKQFMRWSPKQRAWECSLDPRLRERALEIAWEAQTWESVGEPEPSMWDSDDAPDNW